MTKYTSTPWHIFIKLKDTKDKEKILKQAKINDKSPAK